MKKYLIIFEHESYIHTFLIKSHNNFKKIAILFSNASEIRNIKVLFCIAFI